MGDNWGFFNRNTYKNDFETKLKEGTKTNCKTMGKWIKILAPPHYYFKWNPSIFYLANFTNTSASFLSCMPITCSLFIFHQLSLSPAPPPHVASFNFQINSYFSLSLSPFIPFCTLKSLLIHVNLKNPSIFFQIWPTNHENMQHHRDRRWVLLNSPGLVNWHAEVLLSWSRESVRGTLGGWENPVTMCCPSTIIFCWIKH